MKSEKLKPSSAIVRTRRLQRTLALAAKQIKQPISGVSEKEIEEVRNLILRAELGIRNMRRTLGDPEVLGKRLKML